jgi:hypothetical protein
VRCRPGLGRKTVKHCYTDSHCRESDRRRANKTADEVGYEKD